MAKPARNWVVEVRDPFTDESETFGPYTEIAARRVAKRLEEYYNPDEESEPNMEVTMVQLNRWEEAF